SWPGSRSRPRREPWCSSASRSARRPGSEGSRTSACWRRWPVPRSWCRARPTRSDLCGRWSDWRRRTRGWSSRCSREPRTPSAGRSGPPSRWRRTGSCTGSPEVDGSVLAVVVAVALPVAMAVAVLVLVVLAAVVLVTVVTLRSPLGRVDVRVPAILDEVDALAAGVVLAAVLAPVLRVAGGHAEVDRRALD